MATRQDSARNPKYESLAPYTLNLATALAVSLPPVGTTALPIAPAGGELPPNVIDMRFQRGASFQIVASGVTGTATIEPQWSIDGVNWNSFSQTSPIALSYTLTIAANGSYGYLFDAPWVPWLRFQTLTAATAGTATITWLMRN